MNTSALFLALPLIFSGLLTGSIAIYAFSKRTQEFGEFTFGLLMSALTVWSVAYAFEILAPTLAGDILWAKITYFGISFIGPFWFAFALRYTQRAHLLTRRVLVGLILIVSITLSMVLTNERHGLIWADVGMGVIIEGVTTLRVTRYGMWFWVHTAVTYLLILGGIGQYVRTYARAPRLYRRQIGIMVIGSLIPMVGNVLYLIGASPLPGLDLTPFMFSISGVLLAIGLFHFNLLNVNPVAAQVVVDNLRDAVVVLDAKGRIREINASTEMLFDVIRDKVIGQYASAVLGADDEERGIWALPDLKHEIPLGQGDVRRWFELRISPLTDRRGGYHGRVAVLHDVTHEHALQQLRDELTHMLVHDLRNPLGALHTALKVLEQDAADLGVEDLQRSIDIAKRSSKRANELVDCILDINQLEGGRMPVNMESVSLANLVDEVIREMQPLAIRRQIALTARVSEQLPNAHADPQLLDRVLRNLLSNALKFTPPEGEVALSANSEAVTMVVTVSDSGPGISPKVAPRLFQKFATAHQGRGLGLGLAFCKLAVETMGGRIWAEPNGDSGAVFRFTLPIAP